MSKRKNDKEQFENYLKGQMTPQEAHDFERSVLNDPFEQEALEGLESQDPSIVLSDISKLQNRTNRPAKSGFSWMRIAAAIALLVVSSFVIWNVIQPLQEPNELAMETEQAEPESSAEMLDEEEYKEEDAFFTEDVMEEPADEAIAIAPASSPNQSLDAGPVVQEQSIKQDIQNEEVEELNKTSDVQVERFALAEDFADDAVEENESQGEADVSNFAAGASSQIAVASEFVESEREERIQFLDEVVEESTTEPARSRAFARDSKKSAPATASTPLGGLADRKQPEPANGYDNYQEYLKSELRYPEEALRNSIKGTVTLELTVSEGGLISNIEIKRSLGYGCDEEAIRLVKDGPAWLPTAKDGQSQEDRVKVKVDFEL